MLAYFRVAYRKPGFVEHTLEEVVAKENNVEVTVSRAENLHRKHMSTENDDREIEESDHAGEENSGPDMNGKLLKEKNKVQIQTPVVEEEKEEVFMVETRFCTVCCLEQPLRAKHCRECGKCIAVHDHHCPWIGVCIGEKNRFYFWWYLFFECVLLWVSAGLVVKSISDEEGWQWIIDNWAKLPIMIILSFFIIMVTCLLGYHTYLAMANQTTWENVSWEKISYMKMFSRKFGSPFSKGLFSNIYYYCCKKYPDAYTIWHITKKPTNTS